VLARFLEQLLDEEMPALAAFGLDDGREGIEPLSRFLRVFVIGGGAEDVLGLG
jgi:hypothetical protein